jgi:hypothetical protein
VPESGEFVRKLGALAVGRPEIAIYRAEAVSVPALSGQ